MSEYCCHTDHDYDHAPQASKKDLYNKQDIENKMFLPKSLNTNQMNEPKWADKYATQSRKPIKIIQNSACVNGIAVKIP